MTNEHAAQFLIEMKEGIDEIRKIVSQPTTSAERATENARRLAELETAITEALGILNDKNKAFPNRVYAAITMLEVALEEDIPF